MSLPLLVEHHLAARLLEDVLLSSLHQAERAPPPLPHPVHLRLALVQQGGHPQEARDQLQEHLGVKGQDGSWWCGAGVYNGSNVVHLEIVFFLRFFLFHTIPMPSWRHV